MSRPTLVVITLVVIAFIATISIFSKIGKNIGNLPQSTPLDIPSALRKINDTEETYASESGILKTAFPSASLVASVSASPKKAKPNDRRSPRP
jgi:hypothetical protein